MNSVMGIGAQGIQTGNRMLAKSGHEIATVNVERAAPDTDDAVAPVQRVEAPRDLEKPLVELEESKVLVQANAQVVEVGSETIGTLLDIKA